MGNACAICKRQKVVEQKAETVTTTVVETKAIKNGFCRIYPGVRCGDKSYTCPVLALHTWSKDSFFSKIHGSTMGTSTQSGIFSGVERSNTTMQATNQKQQSSLIMNESIQMIPIEDILSVTANTDVTRSKAQQTERRLKTTPPEDLSCGEKTKKWCMSNVCCCCCTPTEAPRAVVETTRNNEEASRVIVFTIERTKYSNVNTPSNLKVVSTAKQNSFYENKLNEDVIKFHYLRSSELNETNFNSKVREAETLARVITQIKGMSPNYPDPAELQQILKQQDVGFFGFETNEEMPTGTAPGKVVSVNKTTIHEE